MHAQVPSGDGAEHLHIAEVSVENADTGLVSTARPDALVTDEEAQAYELKVGVRSACVDPGRAARCVLGPAWQSQKHVNTPGNGSTRWVGTGLRSEVASFHMPPM